MKNTDIFQSRLSSITIDNEEDITKNYFNENYGYAGLPVLFKKAFRNMDIREKWTRNYLADTLPDKELLENIKGDGKNRFLTVKEYMGNDAPGYYFKTSRHLINNLAADYTTPSLFDCWYANTASGTPRNRLSWLYVGKEDTFSDIHRDIWWSSAWNYLISGVKLWFIYPPVFNEFIKRDIEKYSVKDAFSNPASILEQEYKPLICLQQSGDLVFIPGNYYHAVYNIEDTVSLTENFVNETNYDMVRSYFRTRSNRKNMNSIEAIIREGFERRNF